MHVERLQYSARVICVRSAEAEKMLDSAGADYSLLAVQIAGNYLLFLVMTIKVPHF